MKLYIVNLEKPVPYIKVREVAKKIEPLATVNVVEKDKIYEFQSKVVAIEVATVFDGEIDIIEYDITDILK